ncbi:MAG: carboxymuconolactone decarboxylase family protein [Myxococcales bacterium]|nr:carboxymuconolactone decarboxylase family protein [Myxococcales bacterium]
MKKTILVLAFLVLSASVAYAKAPKSPTQGKKAQTIFRAGKLPSFRGPKKYFTGQVKVDMLFPPNQTAHYSGAYVTFQPKARSAWHLHPAGQHMIVISGVGLTGTRDGKVLQIKAGDTIWCPPNLDHWHGAAPHTSMTHLVITGVHNRKNVVWKEKVTDAQYEGHLGSQVLTAKQKSMVTISAFAANGDLNKLKHALVEGLQAGLTVSEIKEILVQLYAYVGFPRSLNGLATLMMLLKERQKKGIKDTLGRQARPLPHGKSVLALGTENQTRLVGGPVVGGLFRFSPEIDRFLKAHLFGAIFGRDVLDWKSRELATVAALASMKGVSPQLSAHYRIGMHNGLTVPQIRALIAIIKARVGQQEAALATSVLDGFLKKKK